MIDIMKKRSNNYKIPHSKKDAMFAKGELPSHLKCDLQLVHEVEEYLNTIE